MFSLAKLRRPKAGSIQSERHLRSFGLRDTISLELLALQHNECVRAIESLQLRMEILTNQDRELVGRVDLLEGKQDSTRGLHLAG